MDVSLTREDQDFIEQKVRSGEYPSVADVLRDGLRLLRARDTTPERWYDAWREDARRKIDAGFESSLRGESIPGDEVIEWLRQRREAKRKGSA